MVKGVFVHRVLASGAKQSRTAPKGGLTECTNMKYNK